MKKTTSLLALLMIMVVLLSACGGSGTVQKIADEAQGELAPFKEAYGENADISVTARGDALVFTFKFLVDVGAKEEVAPQLEIALEAQKSMFEEYVKQIKDAGVSGASVIVEYKDKDNNILLNKEFK